MNKGDNSLWLFFKCQIKQMFSFRSALTECTVRILDKKKYISHFRDIGRIDLFHMKKNKILIKKKVTLRRLLVSILGIITAILGTCICDSGVTDKIVFQNTIGGK